jgi:tol-pal system protein YbgF
MLVLFGSIPTAQADRYDDLNARLTRLERLIENQVLNELLREVDGLKRELRILRGELEVHGHEIRSLQGQQRELYVDADRRLATLEGRAPSAVPPPTSPVEDRAPMRPTEPPAPPVGAPREPPVAAAGEQAAYEEAFNLLTEGRYEQAEQAFTRFLMAYPGGAYADNAQYWLGEVYYLTRDFDRALAEFNKVLTDYPDSAKRPNALLKIGFVHYEKGQWKDASGALSRVVTEYPTSSAARLASNRLDQMKREGR